MRIKRAIFICCLLLALVSMASVSASDIDVQSNSSSLGVLVSSGDDVEDVQSSGGSLGVLVSSGDDVEDVQSSGGSLDDGLQDVLPSSSLDNNLKEVQSNGDSSDDDKVASSNENNVLNASFNDLQSIIDSAHDGDVIELDRDYSFQEGGSTLLINKNITIKGNDYTISGGQNARIFEIRRDGISVVFKGITFADGYSQEIGAAIFNNYSSAKITLFNCSLQYNYAIGHFNGLGGGAVFTRGDLSIINTTFWENTLIYGYGGAIHCRGELFLNDTIFVGNTVDGEIVDGVSGHIDDNVGADGSNNFYQDYGGAIYCHGKSNIYDSEFRNNIAGAKDNKSKSYGGAIYSHDYLYIYNTTFSSNNVSVENGGAIYCEGDLYGDSLSFKFNNAYSGCAIFCEGETHIYRSEFIGNMHIENTTQKDYDWMAPTHLDPGLPVVASCGGAIYSVGKCYIDSCIFDGNIASEVGGAICAVSNLTITGKNSFTNNEVSRHFYFDINILAWRWIDKMGGAIYCNGTANISNADFSGNVAYVDGGAIYAEGKCTVNNCNFEKNSAHGIELRSPMGGAIRSNGVLTVNNCSFNENDADVSGGAIYADGKSYIYNSSFKKNYAEAGIALVKDYGGAIRSKGSITLDNCSFENNHNANYGGAIYTEGDINVNHSSFSGNKAGSIDGGAIYCEGDAIIDYSNFTNNQAEIDGGAVFSRGKTTIYNSRFNSNKVTGSYVEKPIGGAVRSKGEVNVVNSSFESNHANRHGGAIYADSGIDVSNSNFTDNKANVDGGAIYSDGETHINNSRFECNNATHGTDAKSFGGAVRSNGEITIETSTFNDNFAYHNGGAVYADKGITIKQSFFTDNQAYLIDGGAVYSNDDATISDSMFRGNSALGRSKDYRAYGGAVCSYGVVTLKKTNFYDNFAYNRGGAIFAFKEIKITDCSFINNYAADYGGAIFTRTIKQKVTNSVFNNNTATSGDGGAIYVNNSCNPEFASCTFEGDSASGDGGAIYMDSSTSYLKLNGCLFNKCSAKEGGAVYAHQLSSSITRCNFTNNKATSGDGGALYVKNDDLDNYSIVCEFVTCRFENNTAGNRGGAIFFGSKYSDLKVSYCTFVDNHADKRDYQGKKRRAGHSIFNMGYFKTIDMCWFGKNDPSFNEELVEYHTTRSDEDHVPTNYLRIYIKINDTDLYVGNPYNLTVYFKSTKGYTLGKDLMHSTGSFYGDGVFSNLYVDLNDMTSDVVLTKENPTIHGRLDHQELTLKPNVKAKSSSMVVIESCEDVEYPNALKVDYQIVNMTKAGYSIVNSQGRIVSQGNIIDSKSTITVDNLDVGTYSITIYNAENKSTNPSNASASFKVYKNLGTANVTADNVTYGDYTTITLKADTDGLYNVSINNTVLEMEVTNGIATQQVKLNAGSYQTHTSAGDGVLFDCNEASFNVSKASPNFNITVSKDEFDYGEDVLVSYELPADATSISQFGALAVYINNNWHANFDIGDEVRFTGLDIGSYFIEVYYSGDNNYLLDKDNVSFSIKQLENNVIISVSNVTYGEKTLIKISADVDGVYQLDVNGTVYNVTVENGVGEKSLKLNAGSYYANASFDNEHYDTTVQNASFEVYKADVDLILVVFDEVYGDEIETIVYSDLDGEYNLTINGDSSIVTVKDNFAYFEHGTLDAGTYTANVSFTGNGNYNPAFYETSFTVYPYGTSFEIEVSQSEISYGGDATVIHSISEGATGTIKYFLNDGTFLGELDVSEDLTLPKLDVGTYVIIGNYSGDHDFLPAHDSTRVTITPAQNNAQVTVSNVTYGQDSIIEVSADVDGIYKVEINGTTYNVIVSNGLGNKSIPLNAGSYYANVTFDNRNYNTSSKNTVFEVYKADINLIVTVAEVVYFEDILGIVYSDVDGEYNLTVGGYSTIININEGFAEFNAGLFDAGNYTVVVTYPGDENHNANSSSANVTVGKYVPKLQVSVQDIDYGDAALIAIICDLQGSVNVTVNGITQTLELGGKVTRLLFASSSVVKSQTRGFLTLHNLDAGVYPVTVVYNGDDNIESVEADEEFEVHALNTTMDIEAKDITVGENGKITVKLPSNATGNITVTVDGKNYTAELKDGKATISIPNLSAGNKNAKVYYSGCNNYNPSESEVSFKVSKVKPDMTAESNDPIKKGEKLHIVVKLPKDATGNVSITVDGKTYTKAVKDGKAVFDISGLAPGRYGLKAVYSGDDKYGEDQVLLTITVKDNGHDNNNNNTDNPKNKHSKNIDLASKVTGNPILALILTLMAIGIADIRRFKK